MDYILIVLLLIMCVICMAMAFLMKGMHAELEFLRAENTLIILWMKAYRNESKEDILKEIYKTAEIEK